MIHKDIKGWLLVIGGHLMVTIGCEKSGDGEGTAGVSIIKIEKGGLGGGGEGNASKTF